MDTKLSRNSRFFVACTVFAIAAVAGLVVAVYIGASDSRTGSAERVEPVSVIERDMGNGWTVHEQHFADGTSACAVTVAGEEMHLDRVIESHPLGEEEHIQGGAGAPDEWPEDTEQMPSWEVAVEAGCLQPEDVEEIREAWGNGE